MPTGGFRTADELTHVEREAFEADFKALCIRRQVAAAMFIPIVQDGPNGAFVERSLTAGEPRACGLLDTLLLKSRRVSPQYPFSR